MTFADRAEAEARALNQQAIAEAAQRQPAKRKYRLRVRLLGRYAKGGRQAWATVLVDQALTLHIRPLHSRKVRSVPLAAIAELAFQKLAIADAGAARARRPRRAR